MIPLTPELKQHLRGEATTLCNCWRIIRKDGQEIGFTDHDETLFINGFSYEALSGFEPSEIETNLGLNIDSQQVIGALQSHAITERDIEARKYDGSSLEHRIVNWSHPVENVVLNTFVMGEIKRQDGAFLAEINSLTALLDETKGRRFEHYCSADLGDPKCGVELASQYTDLGTVTQTDDELILKIELQQNRPANWFRGGRLTFTDGDNQSVAVEIAEHYQSQLGSAEHILHLWQSLPETINVGDHFSISPGCDKQFSTCHAKFENALNFRGFPHIPGAEFALSYASNSEKMDGGPLVP